MKNKNNNLTNSEELENININNFKKYQIEYLNYRINKYDYLLSKINDLYNILDIEKEYARDFHSHKILEVIGAKIIGHLYVNKSSTIKFMKKSTTELNNNDPKVIVYDTDVLSEIFEEIAKLIDSIKDIAIEENKTGSISVIKIIEKVADKINNIILDCKQKDIDVLKYFENNNSLKLTKKDEEYEK